MLNKWFDKIYASNISFKPGDLVLKWDEDHTKLGNHQKLYSLWYGPYHIVKQI